MHQFDYLTLKFYDYDEQVCGVIFLICSALNHRILCPKKNSKKNSMCTKIWNFMIGAFLNSNKKKFVNFKPMLSFIYLLNSTIELMW